MQTLRYVPYFSVCIRYWHPNWWHSCVSGRAILRAFLTRLCVLRARSWAAHARVYRFGRGVPGCANWYTERWLVHQTLIGTLFRHQGDAKRRDAKRQDATRQDAKQREVKRQDAKWRDKKGQFQGRSMKDKYLQQPRPEHGTSIIWENRPPEQKPNSRHQILILHTSIADPYIRAGNLIGN